LPVQIASDISLFHAGGHLEGAHTPNCRK
jgi:hypothetical protein